MSGQQTDDVPLPVRETHRFVAAHIGAAPKRVLEVGAGTGELATLLRADGHTVTALDASADVVARARARGHDVTHATWPNFDAHDYDAVLFTRSLHHIHELVPAVQRACAALVPGGRIIVEDFAFHDADRPTVAWFRDLAFMFCVSRRGKVPADSFAVRMSKAADPLEDWHADAGDIHSAEAMRKALASCATITFEAEAPYLYRYIGELVGGDELEHMQVAEIDAARAGTLKLLGRRYVGHV